MNKTVRAYQRLLVKVGFPIKVDGKFGQNTKQAVLDFQRGFAFWNLKVTGRLDLKTKAAIRYSAARGGKTSAHFYFREFKSKGNGWIKVNRALVRALEKLRRYGRVSILSGYRDPRHNQNVGGASSSQHMYGTAADLISPHAPLNYVRNLKVFSGIGVSRATGRVIHVDVRHAGPNNTTGGSPSAPTIWYYG